MTRGLHLRVNVVEKRTSRCVRGLVYHRGNSGFDPDRGDGIRRRNAVEAHRTTLLQVTGDPVQLRSQDALMLLRNGDRNPLQPGLLPARRRPAVSHPFAGTGWRSADTIGATLLRAGCCPMPRAARTIGAGRRFLPGRLRTCADEDEPGLMPGFQLRDEVGHEGLDRPGGFLGYPFPDPDEPRFLASVNRTPVLRLTRLAVMNGGGGKPAQGGLFQMIQRVFLTAPGHGNFLHKGLGVHVEASCENRPSDLFTPSWIVLRTRLTWQPGWRLSAAISPRNPGLHCTLRILSQQVSPIGPNFGLRLERLEPGVFGSFTPARHSVSCASTRETGDTMTRKGQTLKTAKNGTRRKHSLLYVNDAEIAQIKADAKSAGMSVLAYVRHRVLEGPVVSRADWRACVKQQATIIDQLEGIAQAVEDRTGTLDAGRILLALRTIEQQADGLMPGAPGPEDGAKGEDNGNVEDAPLADTAVGPPC